LSDSFNQVGVIDPHEEQTYSAVHFDLDIVIELLQMTIAEKRSTEKFIMLEGMCNTGKMANEDEALALRYMDELFKIEKTLGNVDSVISLTFIKEESSNDLEENKQKWEDFPDSTQMVSEIEQEEELDEDGNPIV
jgi:hypothetical protein